MYVYIYLYIYMYICIIHIYTVLNPRSSYDEFTRLAETRLAQNMLFVL